MCGINGLVSISSQFNLDPFLLKKMTDRLSHRGPDDLGQWQGEMAYLGMRRLSIIDVDGGQQPISNEDDSLWLVFNGEIYNYLELRTTLQARGHRFKTSSDSEVILHAYEEYGPDCLQQFNGMFAFAVWDERRRQLFLARDRLGIKPLYYWLSNGSLAFASELKALKLLPGFPREMNLVAMDLFLALEYIPAPYTIYDGVSKLPAGHYLIFQDGKIDVAKYWDLEHQPLTLTEDEACEQFDALVEDSVRLRLRSDVPVGAFLSGGIDSSTVLSYMHQLNGPGVNSYSIGFGDASYNELPFARMAAKRYETNHVEATLVPEIRQHLNELVSHFDEPFADFSMFPTYLVSQLAQNDVKVVLSGDGGDEVFAGYDTYVAQYWAQRYYHHLPKTFRRRLFPSLLSIIPPQNAKKGMVNKLKRFVEGGALPPELGHTRWMVFLDAAGKQALYRPDVAQKVGNENVLAYLNGLFAEAPFVEPLARQQFVDIKSYLAENILTKVDRMSMATSLEVRVPLLDHRLVEFALNLPATYRFRPGQTKYLMRKAMAGRIPTEILNKPKEGFSIPLKHWLRSSLRPLMQELLDARQVRDRGLFAPETVQRWQDEHFAGQANHSHRLWALMVLEIWCRNQG